MKTLSWILALPLAAPCLAQEAAGTPQSGVSVQEGDEIVLKDLSRQSCAWKSGLRLEREMPLLRTFLARLESVGAAYRALLESQLASTNFCFSENQLIPIDRTESASVMIFEDNNVQLAIRVGAEIYVDQQLFEQLDADNQTFLVVHELMHVFFRNDLDRRNSKMRGFTKFLFELYRLDLTEGALESYKQELQRQIVLNSVGWPIRP